MMINFIFKIKNLFLIHKFLFKIIKSKKVWMRFIFIKKFLYLYPNRLSIDIRYEIFELLSLKIIN